MLFKEKVTDDGRRHHGQMTKIDHNSSGEIIKKALIRLRRCEGWSAPFLLANPKDRFSHV